MRLPMFAFYILLTLSTVWAQGRPYNGYCSNETIHGAYSGSCTGWITPAPNAPMTQFTALLTIMVEANGNVAGGGKASIGRMIVDQTVTGKSSIGVNCSGTVSYEQKINGQPAPKVNIVFHVLGRGDEIRGMGVDPGTAMVCNLRRALK